MSLVTVASCPLSTAPSKAPRSCHCQLRLPLLLIGYRFYDENQINFTTGFPFGHGLSYTQFDYSALRVTRTGVSLTVANTGASSGANTNANSGAI